ncbi:hypothetical protein KBB48_00930 [Candidatus Shapirobacteria bacterium]|nr:hypothetical protein [Candidatus Shapirobacteria bacterium]
MFSQDELRIISDIKSYAAQHPSKWKDWYFGIAADPKQRLFVDHSVTEKGDVWIYRPCINSESARKIEDYFVNNLETKGDVGGGDNDTKYVYAYLITSHSRE